MGSKRLVFALLMSCLLVAPVLLGQTGKESSKESEKGATAKLRIEVTGDTGDPVDNASVYVRWEKERKLAKDQKYEQNWKTNREGLVKVPSVPRGKVLVQVVAQGWKTFGQWYELDQDEVTIKIKLQKPPRWY